MGILKENPIISDLFVVFAVSNAFAAAFAVHLAKEMRQRQYYYFRMRKCTLLNPSGHASVRLRDDNEYKELVDVLNVFTRPLLNLQ